MTDEAESVCMEGPLTPDWEEWLTKRWENAGKQEESISYSDIAPDGGAGAARGTAYHRVMELLPFDQMESQADVEAYLARMVERDQMTAESCGLIDSSAVWTFLSSEFGQRMKRAPVSYTHLDVYKRQHYENGVVSEQVLDILCKVIPDSGLLKNSVIALDGYTGFTPVQYRLAELFMVYARQVVVTVTADPEISMYRSMGVQNLFYMSRQMTVRLSELAEKNNIEKLDDIQMEKTARHDRCGAEGEKAQAGRFPEGGELAFLEKRLFRYGRGSYTGEMDGSLELYQAVNPSGEVACVCLLYTSVNTNIT